MKIVFTTALLIATFVSAIQVVIAQHEARRVFIETEKLESERDHLNEEWGRLQLEQSTWATADRIEQLATTELQMVDPDINSIVLLPQ